MPLKKFLIAYLLGSIPYAIIITYAGSISSLENPWPGIIITLVLSLILWSGGAAFMYWCLRGNKNNR